MRKDILSVENITMQFGGVVAVNNLSLHIPEGQIVALIGPNGAGKTTAFNCITGVYEPTNGRGLAGAVRADQSDDLAGIDIHGQVVDGDDAAKLHRDMLHMKDGCAHACFPPFADSFRSLSASPASESSRVPMMPLRKKSTTIMMMTENTNTRLA